MGRREVGLGVIGLGRRWERYRLSLAGLRRTLAVRAVYDPCAGVAERVARDLECSCTGGVLDLVSRPEVEAVLVLDSGWQGLWPVEQAVRAGKPVLCAAPLSRESTSTLEAAARGVVQVALAPRLGALVDRLRDLLDERLGQARYVHVRWSVSQPEERDVLDVPGLIPLLHATTCLMESTPQAVRVLRAAGEPGFASLVLEFGEAGLAHLSCRSSPWVRPGCRIEVEGASGVAEGAFPGGAVRWWTDEGEHQLRPARELPEQVGLARFAQVVREGGPVVPSLAEMLEVVNWLRAARQG